jgi:hypothetical protein
VFGFTLSDAVKIFILRIFTATCKSLVGVRLFPTSLRSTVKFSLEEAVKAQRGVEI